MSCLGRRKLHQRSDLDPRLNRHQGQHRGSAVVFAEAAGQVHGDDGEYPSDGLSVVDAVECSGEAEGCTDWEG